MASPKLDTDKILEHVEKGSKNLDKIIEALAFTGLFSIFARYTKSPLEALESTALSYFLFKSGSEIGVASVMGTIAIKSFEASVLSAIPSAEDSVFVPPGTDLI